MRRYEPPERRPTRAHWYDYRESGWYFVTICTYDRESLLGGVQCGQMYLNHLGRIVEASWLHLPRHYPRVLLDAFVVMPNHIHGIVILDELLDPSIRKPPGLSQVIGSLKTDSAKRINNVRSSRGVAVWQRSFHDQIIRNEQHLDNVRAYITNNPARWHDDAENPDTW